MEARERMKGETEEQRERERKSDRESKNHLFLLVSA